MKGEDNPQKVKPVNASISHNMEKLKPPPNAPTIKEEQRKKNNTVEQVLLPNGYCPLKEHKYVTNVSLTTFRCPQHGLSS